MSNDDIDKLKLNTDEFDKLKKKKNEKNKRKDIQKKKLIDAPYETNLYLHCF